MGDSNGASKDNLIVTQYLHLKVKYCFYIPFYTYILKPDKEGYFFM